MPDQIEDPSIQGLEDSGGGAPEDSSGGAPRIQIPVEEEDFARKKRRKVLSWWALFLIVAGVFAYVYKRSNDPLEAQKSLDTAQRLFSLARYDQAVVACERAIGLRPNFAEAYMLRGRAHLAAYEAERSVSDFTKAIALRPYDIGTKLDRAQAYIELKRYPEAIADTDSALALDPDLARAYNLRGTAVRAMGDTHRAVSEFLRAVELQPNADNYIQRGSTYQLLGEHQKAILDFTEAIHLDPEDAEVYFARAESERALGDTKKAQEDHNIGRYLDGK